MAKMPKDSAMSAGAQDKESVNYRMGDPQGERCETCTNYRPEQELCSMVQGQIGAAGVCDLYSSLGEDEEGAELVDDPGAREAAMMEMLFGGAGGGGMPPVGGMR